MTRIRTEVIRLLDVEEDCHVRPRLDVVVYFDDKPDARAVYTGTPDHLSFDRWETRNRLDGWESREWSGQREFRARQGKVGDEARKAVERERLRVEQAISDGYWLREAFAVAEREAERAGAWADERVRALAAKPRESFGKHSSLASEVESADLYRQELVKQVFRLRMLSNALRLLRDAQTLDRDA